MSWAAHDLEPYLFRAKLGGVVSLPLCLLGSYSPDIATKWAVYGCLLALVGVGLLISAKRRARGAR